jgi:hypothetical protein
MAVIFLKQTSKKTNVEAKSGGSTEQEPGNGIYVEEMEDEY